MEEPETGPIAKDWYVFHVKPRSEKKVAEWLAFYRFFCHLPLYLKVTKVQRRKVRRYLPLFPGYVFTRLKPDGRVTMLKTNLLVRTIAIPPGRVREVVHQLRQIKNATRKTRVVRVAHTFKAGDRVRITMGVMRGTEGYVKREGPNATLCLNCDILGASVEVAISPADLEAAEKV